MMDVQVPNLHTVNMMCASLRTVHFTSVSGEVYKVGGKGRANRTATAATGVRHHSSGETDQESQVSVLTCCMSNSSAKYSSRSPF